MPISEQDVLLALSRAGRTPKEYKDSFVVNCLYPDHSDSSPSMFVDKQGRYFRCWGCGRHGSVIQLFQEIGIPFDGTTKNSTTYAQIQWEQAAKQTIVKPAPDTLLPSSIKFAVPFRSYSPEFLARFDARFWTDPFGHARIVLPFRQRNILVGYTARGIEKEAFPKYHNVEYMPAKEVLFPYDLVPTDYILTLVEGPMDALRLNSVNIPACAILGTNNWSPIKCSLVLAKRPKLVLLMMDADDAGRKAEQVIYSDLRKYVEIQAVKLPVHPDPSKITDPDNVSQDWLAWFISSTYIPLLRNLGF